MIELGDKHNGQKNVFICKNNYIFKPRCIYWECLFLSKNNSVLGDFLHKDHLLIENNLYPSWYKVMPSLQFKPSDINYNSGYIKYQSLRKIEHPLDNEYYWESFGAVIGMLAMFGVTDLHFENILFGKDSENKIIFGAIDIECIFNKIILLSQTHLLPSKINDAKECGLIDLKRVFDLNPIGKNIAALIFGYISFFEKFEKKFCNFFFHDKYILNYPIRVILQSTKNYKTTLLNNKFLDKKFNKYELEQLLRNDIPYFFRFLNSIDIYYYDINNMHPIVTDIKLTGRMEDVNKYLIPSIESYNSIKERNVNLSKIGALQLVKFFMNREINGEYSYKNLKFYTNSNLIKINNNYINWFSSW
ncbi:DUF4135 domain-containing protein [Fluviispira vulneris]|uniref:DUF4135 domain-containing protein n=1 Tax=Fluviispira vulneris TaxID=2763012 RepID=UPI0016486990|nr:DUF4135 domain-containing protein [Fluviispira vulneris]